MGTVRLNVSFWRCSGCSSIWCSCIRNSSTCSRQRQHMDEGKDLRPPRLTYALLKGLGFRFRAWAQLVSQLGS